MKFLSILTSQKITKANIEIQSIHFGGSRKQVILHIIGKKCKNKSKNSIEHKSICTISESKQHDTVAVCAHLMPTFAKIKIIVPDLKKPISK